MALNKIFAGSQEKNRDIPLTDVFAPASTTTIQPGVPVAIGGALATARPAVSLTASGNGTVTQTTNLPSDITSVTYKNGGVGNSSSPASATFAFDGSYEFPVTGATTSTGNGVPVYITTAGVLTLTVGSNLLYGTTDFPKGYTKTNARAVVKIGA